jgi:murein DD-endopeptidase MepM/ murein hydrolase activator NlpD
VRFFPVAGSVATFWDDFGQPRNNGRTHQGNDIFSPVGTELVAADSGMLTRADNPLGGMAWALKADEGTRYYYAHLLQVAREPGRVEAGEVIGYLGTSGNARGAMPHLHFEVHPDGGAPVDPYPKLRDATRVAGHVDPFQGMPPARLIAAAIMVVLVPLAAEWLATGRAKAFLRALKLSHSRGAP